MTKQIAIAFIIGAGLTALLYPMFFKRQLEESRLISDNAHIERQNKLIESLTKKLKTTNAPVRKRKTANTANA